ncbi:rhamnosyltransferase [Bacteroidia bacterium]|nr:rhamnosyltransferase [Bacteroidia bacterium]
MKRVAIIGTNGLPGNYGGWDQLVKHLTTHLRNDFEFIVYTSSIGVTDKLKDYQGTKLQYIPFKANGIQSIPYDICSLVHAAFACDILFICGTSGCISLPLIKLINRNIVLNPDGQEWKRGKWNKAVQWFLKVSESLGVRFAKEVISDNKIIQEYILSEYQKDSTLIEYGGDQVLKMPLSEETAQKYGIQSQNYAFKVCRIEPENNIHLIIDAFRDFPEMPLILIGNWYNSDYGKQLREENRQYGNLKLLDPIYDQTTLDELRSNCKVYIHGHSVGGTNPSLVEAMNLSLCIVSFDADYNRETTENQALYFRTKEELINILKKLNDMEILQIGSCIMEIAKRRYLWRIITGKYKKVFSL